MNVFVSKSKLHGKGIFALKDIKKGQFIQHIKGNIKIFIPSNKKESISYPNWVGVGKNKWIDPKYPNLYLNHSCNPIAGIKGKVIMVALRDIKKGEEITIDYSIIEGDDRWEMRCHCGARNCRKIIRSVQFLPKRQYQKYLPWVPTYFQKLHDTYNYSQLKHG
ncbi:MAG: SET domain-containing protein-lysine N-methyltransferase [Patescibacteria group bacterium]